MGGRETICYGTTVYGTASLASEVRSRPALHPYSYLPTPLLSHRQAHTIYAEQPLTRAPSSRQHRPEQHKYRSADPSTDP